MAYQIAPSIDVSARITEIDILKDSTFAEVNSTFIFAPANSPKEALVLAIPIGHKGKFGLKQPRVKAAGTKLSALAISPVNPLNVALGTVEGNISLFALPAAGIKIDFTKSEGSFNAGEEIKAISFSPVVDTLIAAAVRNGHILLFDKELKAPIADLAQSRPLTTIVFSSDGTLIYALYVDMVLRIWDVRKKEVLKEVSVISGRGTGYLEALPGNKVLVSYINGKYQEIAVFDAAGEKSITKQLEQKPGALVVKFHFTNTIIASANKESKVYVLDGVTLETIATFNHTGPILSFGIDGTKPNPDGDLLLTVAILNTNQVIDKVNFNVPAKDVPIQFPPFPLPGASLSVADFLGGQDGVVPTEALVSTKDVVVVVEEEKVEKGPITRFRFLMGEADPPSEYFINLPVGNTANPEFNEICSNGKQFAFIGHGSPNPIYVVPLAKPFKLPAAYPAIQDAHISLTSYLTFSPHDPCTLR